MRERMWSWRRVRERAFVLCTLWLVVQNLVLLSVLPWERLGVTATVLGAVVQAAWSVCAPLLVAVGSAALGWALTSRLMIGSAESWSGGEKEVRHG